MLEPDRSFTDSKQAALDREPVSVTDTDEYPLVRDILVVEDEPMIRENLADYLRLNGFDCETAASGEEALVRLARVEYALMITDIRMPGHSGLELLAHVSENYPETAVIMITAVADLQTAVDSMKQGALDYITKPFDLEKVTESVRKAIDDRRLRLEEKKITENLRQIVTTKSFALDSALDDLESHRDMTLEALVRALDAREHETQCHSLRVQAYTVRLAEALGIEGDPLTELGRGALLHDIGKIGISDTILLKPGKLSEQEWQEMRKHPLIGYEIVNGVRFLSTASELVRSHHERFDGTGYPLGLKGKKIPLEARLFAIIDTYDAMTSNRPYRGALPPDTARQEIQRCSGIQFDPDLVREFLNIPQSELDAICQRYS